MDDPLSVNKPVATANAEKVTALATDKYLNAMFGGCFGFLQEYLTELEVFKWT
ncbi:MAG: hypothetical protein WCK54_04065 [Desulfuromonadales bacterium]